MTVCYLCGESVDDGVGSGDHVIPRALLGDKPPKVNGFNYGGRVRAHLECNNRFGDETHVRKALQLFEEPSTTRERRSPRPAPGRVKGPRARVERGNASPVSVDGIFGSSASTTPGTMRRRASTIPSTTPASRVPISGERCCAPALSVLAKSAAALLVSRHLAELPGNCGSITAEC